MKEVRVNGLKPGTVLAMSVRGKSGNTMLEKGTFLTENYIRRLQEIGITSVFIQPTEPPMEPPIHNSAPASRFATKLIATEQREELKNNGKARLEATSLLRDCVTSWTELNKLGAPMHNSENQRRMRHIWFEILSQRSLVDEFGVLLQTDRFLFEHTLRVGLLSFVVGLARNYDTSRLYELTVGALLFDIGMTFIPAELIRKKQKLSTEEVQLIQLHTTEGFRLLSSIPEVPSASAKCALAHHERFRGEGYPFRLKSSEIPPYAQIVGLTDLYDAIMSPRHYRNAFTPSEAMEYLFAAGNYDFHLELVQLFLRNVSVYPVSSVVQLSSGQIAIVASTDNEMHHRPIVRIIREADGSSVPIPYDMDLLTCSNVVILNNWSMSV
jgi:HD-GYP domain-containing protein (c-di-GMP phosphodiesterase class II)